MAQVNEEYWTFKGRVASFQSATARRASSTSRGKGSKAASKPVKWPHKFLKPEELAGAGFYFDPQPKQEDNVSCYLCCKSIVGWEKEDDPLVEHLKLSADCGWAIVASLLAGHSDLLAEDPKGESMAAARRATFADRWPHEDKKGWKCKSKQMVDAGWAYQPTAESDDWATCTYCSLSLDGWEPSDNPVDEHFKRSPNCQFFAAFDAQINDNPPAKKASKSRKPRASKGARLSTQSNVTNASEMPTFIDIEDGDLSSMTDVFNNTVQSISSNTASKKTAKKPAARRGKTIKKESIAPVVEAPEPEDDDFEVKIPAEPMKSYKTTDEPATILMASNDGRTTKDSKASTTIDVSNFDKSVSRIYEDALEEPAPAETSILPPKKRATRGKASMAVDDSIIDPSQTKRVKQRAIAQPVDDKADIVDTHIESVTKTKTLANQKRTTRARASVATEDSILPAQPRKRKSFVLEEPTLADQVLDEAVTEADAPEITKKRRATRSRTSITTDVPAIIVKPKKKRTSKGGRKASIAKKQRSPTPELPTDEQIDAQLEAELDAMEQDERAIEIELESMEAEQARKTEAIKPLNTEVEEAQPLVSDPSPDASTMPGKAPAIDASPSPATSDAENQPPSTRLSRQQQSFSARTPHRYAGSATVARTLSPTKRTVLGPLQVETRNLAWNAIDLESALLRSPAKSPQRLLLNEADALADSVAGSFACQQGSALSSPEKRMTVQQWIEWNAGQAEERLRGECERMVGIFEREGLKALLVLEGIECV